MHPRDHGSCASRLNFALRLRSRTQRGLNCNAMGTPQGGSCWWNSGDRMTLNEQARYVFTWDKPSNDQGNYDVHIDFIEDDTIGNDDCKWKFLNPSGEPAKLEEGYAIINMPSWDYLTTQGCADGDAGGTLCVSMCSNSCMSSSRPIASRGVHATPWMMSLPRG